jgi:hypothetical protein
MEATKKGNILFWPVYCIYCAKPENGALLLATALKNHYIFKSS